MKKTDYNKINTNSQFKISGNSFEGKTHIGDKNIITDNSITYEENISDVQNIKSFSFYVTNKFGDDKVRITGFGSFFVGLLSIFASLNSLIQNNQFFSWLPSFSYNISIGLMVFGILLVGFGSILLNALRYKQYAKCQSCGKDYAYEEYKEKKIREVGARTGTKQEITEYLECKFCNNKIERKYTKTIPYEDEED